MDGRPACSLHPFVCTYRTAGEDRRRRRDGRLADRGRLGRSGSDIVVALWVSTRVFRAAIFMRGQNFTRHNLWVALRDAD